MQWYDSHTTFHCSVLPQRVLASTLSPLLYSPWLRCWGIQRKGTMPKSARYTLHWSAEHECYELQTQGNVAGRPLHEDWWFAWLADHASFSFQGKQGHLSLLKEARARGGDYWYAYRSLNRRTVKRYAGRTVDLTAAHLEELARALASAAPAVTDNAEHKDTSSSSQEATEHGACHATGGDGTASGGPRGDRNRWRRASATGGRRAGRCGSGAASAGPASAPSSDRAPRQ